MLDFLKKVTVWLFGNPNRFSLRDSNGRIIDDRKRKKHSKETQEKLENGTLLRPGKDGKLVQYKKGDKPRCYQIDSKAKIVVKQHGKVF